RLLIHTGNVGDHLPPSSPPHARPPQVAAGPVPGTAFPGPGTYHVHLDAELNRIEQPLPTRPGRRTRQATTGKAANAGKPRPRVSRRGSVSQGKRQPGQGRTARGPDSTGLAKGGPARGGLARVGSASRVAGGPVRTYHSWP